MPLVHLFRLLMLFLNVYETLKILKSPPPSARRGGQPSVRAVTQRKRDMKGCLAVWIVWCCFATYERTFDIIISRLVPFYDEFKSLILIFLIVTRAKGAEPIFLHVLRPIIKPYTSTIDSLLDLIRMFGDVFCLLAAIPLRLVLSWWHSLFLYNDEPLEEARSGTDETDADSLRDQTTPDLVPYPPLPPVEPQPDAQRVPTKDQTDIRRPVETRHPSANIAQGTVRTRRHALEAGPKPHDILGGGQSRVSKQESNTSSQHQIWHPPQSSYEPTKKDREPSLAQTRVPLPPNGYPALELSAESDTTSEEPVDEWRQYPPFPSAYPPTPLPPMSQLSLPHSAVNSTILGPSPHRAIDKIQFPSFPIIPDNGQHQDFVQSLLPPRKPLSPGSLKGSSSDDNASMSGIQGQNTDVRSDGAVFGVSDEEHEGTDNEFDVTLRTPHPTIFASRANARPKVSSVASTVASSVPSRSTALTTVDEGSSLRTRTSSESSMSTSTDSSSIASSSAGQKRSLPREHTPVARPGNQAFGSETLKARTSTQRPVARVPSHVVTRSQQQVVRGLAGFIGDDDSDDDAHSGGAWVDRIAPEQKRRRMLGPAREPSVYSTRTKITPQERSAMQRAGSSHSTVSSDGPHVASRASSRLSRRATEPATNASHPGPVPPRRASDKNPTRRR